MGSNRSHETGESPGFLADGGEAGALMRAVDWAGTPVGPIAQWPASLKTTVGTILHSRHPMFLWWGPDLIQFYNDAYVPTFGVGKHPGAMGQRGVDCWQEIWSIMWPQIDDVMRRALPSWNEDHLVPIFRNGRLEEVYWTYGYSPVFDDGGDVGGALVVCTETTRQVIAQRRLRSTRAFADRTALAADAGTISCAAAEVVGSVPHDIPFACLYDCDRDQGAPHLVHAVGVRREPSEAITDRFRAQLHTLARNPAPHPLPDDLRIVTGPWPESVSHMTVLPVRGSGDAAPSGLILFGLSPRLPFDDLYRDYLEDLCHHIAQARARMAAFQVRAVVEHERNSLLQQAPVATALLTGPEHRFELANPLYLRVVGRSDIIGRTFRELFPQLASTDAPAALDRVYRTGVPYVSDEMLLPLDRNGTGVIEDCYFKFNLQPLRDASGAVYGMMAVAVDITEQVAARQVLEKGQAEREALLEELEQASRAKDEFLAMLGHELRNPLSPILTALQLMRLRGVRGADRELEVIERQVAHMVGLVDDLLDISRITRGKIALKIEPLWMTDVVVKAVEMASPLIDQRRHRLSVDIPPELFVRGDLARLAQVVANLLTNAAKYTEPGGDISVRAEVSDDEVSLYVRDTGIGIAPDMLPYIFDTFVQEAQNSARAQGGLGLGLAIVKSLVHMHGGSVSLSSPGVGQGTECLVRLPRAAGSTEDIFAEAPAVPEVATSGGCRILLVDDNKDATEAMADALCAMGHTVRVAFDALEALAIARDYVPEIALLDLGLPVIDGCELARRLKAQEGWERVRLLALTGYGLATDRERTRAAGFEEHLVKPVDLWVLDATFRAGSSARPETDSDLRT